MPGGGHTAPQASRVPMMRPVLQYVSPDRGFVTPRVLRNLRRTGNALMLAGVLVAACVLIPLGPWRHTIFTCGVGGFIVGYMLRASALVSTALVNFMAVRRAHQQEFRERI